MGRFVSGPINLTDAHIAWLESTGHLDLVAAWEVLAAAAAGLSRMRRRGQRHAEAMRDYERALADYLTEVEKLADHEVVPALGGSLSRVRCRPIPKQS